MRLFIASLLLILNVTGNLLAQEKPAGDSETRLDYMRKMIAAVEITPANDRSPLPAEFNSKPILRFADASRETADGAVWKLGSGRPLVLIATEFVRYDGVPNLSYEFLCLTNERFGLRTVAGWNWTPDHSAMEIKPLPARQMPHASADVRLLQMKRLARRFAASQMHEGESYALRLMPQPIDRYVEKADDIDHHGAVFVFANGTNPEILLLLETTPTGWQYGLARMSGASPSVSLDGDVVWNLPPMKEVGKSWKLDYTGDVHPIESE